MLIQRILTILILLPLALAGLLWLTTPQFAVASFLLVIFATNEWLHLMNVEKIRWQLAYFLLMMLLILASLLVSLKLVLAVAVFWWVIALVWIGAYPKLISAWANKGVLAILGIELLVPFWLALNCLRLQSIYTLLFVLVCVWLADSGAYLTGKVLGRHKLLPAVSPGKTVEGVLGGVLLALGFAWLVSLHYPLSHSLRSRWAGLVVATVLMSIVGDLLESMVKRQRGVKDSGRLLPGHGGVLDRIDSLTAALPIYLFGVTLFNLPPIWFK